MGGQVAIAAFPFGRRLGACTAIPTGFNLGGASASLARFDDLMAESTVVTAAFGAHKSAFGTFSDRLANHNNYPLNFLQKKSRFDFIRLLFPEL
jgi:hypothetical protein